MRKILLLALVPAFIIAVSSAGAATANPLDSLSRAIEAFIKGPDGRLAPSTIARAQAMLGAAMLADRKNDTRGRDEAVAGAREALASARSLARDFRSKFKDVLALEAAARETLGDKKDPNFEQAEQRLSQLINAFERGDLNKAFKLAESAKEAFKGVLDAGLPALLHQTDAALIQAARKGAKRYAPVTYQAARAWLAAAVAYLDGKNSQWPRHPRKGLRLARAAAETAVTVRKWRHDPGSHERLLLAARRSRIEIAQAVGLDADAGDPTADVEAARIKKRIEALKRRLDGERKARKAAIETLREQHTQELKNALERQRAEITRNCAEQIARLKEAFRVKLQRATFEQRRQQRLRKLFHKDEADILVNLDGSLLIRLKALKFPSGGSTIDPKSFDLLRRVKQGLQLYPGREIVIEGHTDNRGDPKANQKLSLKRAEAVRNFFIASGLQDVRFKTLGYGDAYPIASNDYELGRAMNRRIDIVIKPPTTK